MAIHVVLVHPEIHWNTGNAGRTCLAAGATLHLVEPLGFSMDDRQLKRAGLDYHEMVNVRVYPDWETCAAALPGRRFALSTHGSVPYAEVAFLPGDAFVFGPESVGLPASFVDAFPAPNRLRIPMRPGNRSLNLSNAVAVTVFEAWRQNGFKIN